MCVLRTERILADSSSLTPIFEHLAWSFNLLFAGRHPSKAFGDLQLLPNEKPGSGIFENGMRFRLVECRGDWKWHVQSFRLKSFYACHQLCHVCGASRKDDRLSFVDFRRAPAWHASERTHLEFISTQLGEPWNALVMTAGWHFRFIRWCSMHVVNLGIGLFANGGAWHELAKIGWFEGTDAAARFRTGFSSFKAFLKCNKIECSQPVFKPWMFVASGDEYCFFGAKATWNISTMWPLYTQGINTHERPHILRTLGSQTISMYSFFG